MSEFYSLEQQKNRPEKPTLEEKLHEEYPELESRLTFAWPLGEKRRKAIKMFNSGTLDSKMTLELLESSDFIERQAGLFLLKECPITITDSSKKDYKKIQSIVEKIIKDGGDGWEIATWAKIKILVVNEGEKALPILEKISENETADWRLADAALDTRIKMIVETHGEEALPILEKMSDENPNFREKLIPAIGDFGEKALPILERMIHDDAYFKDDKELAVQTLGNIGEKTLPILEKMSQDEDSDIRIMAVWALDDIGEKSLPILERMIENEKGKNDIVRRAAIKAKIKIITETQGEKAMQILEKMSQGDDNFVKETIKEEIKQPRWSERQKFLRSRKPLFATPYTKELAQKIIEVSEAADELRKKFKDKFIGLIIFGSTARGYFKPDSDLDWAIIAKDEKVSDYFWKKANSLNLCAKHHIQVNKEKGVDEGDHYNLFCGLFFGDREKLMELQKKVLETINEKEWDEIREIIATEETRLFKAQERFNLKDKELEKIKQFALLLRVPPSYEESLKIVRSNF